MPWMVESTEVASACSSARSTEHCLGVQPCPCLASRTLLYLSPNACRRVGVRLCRGLELKSNAVMECCTCLDEDQQATLCNVGQRLPGKTLPERRSVPNGGNLQCCKHNTDESLVAHATKVLQDVMLCDLRASRKGNSTLPLRRCALQSSRPLPC